MKSSQNEIAQRLFLLLAAAFAYLLPIISADLVYVDDMFRTVGGYMQWADDGRFVGDYVHILFGLGRTLVDTFPLPLVVAGTCFCVVGAVLGKVWNIPGGRFAAAFFLLLGNPFLLSNLYFRYDGSFMLLAVVLAAAPFCFRRINGPIYWCASIALLTLSLSSYQAALAIFIALAGAEAFVISTERRPVSVAVGALGSRVLQLLAAYAIYRFGILAITPMNEYAALNSQLIPLDKTTLHGLTGNLSGSLSVAREAFAGTPGRLFGAAIVLSLIAGLAFALRHSSLAVAGLVAAVAAASLAVVGLQALAVNPVFYPRTFVGFGALPFIALVSIVFVRWRVVYWTFASALLGICFLTNIVATNASRADLAFQRHLATRIISDLDRIGYSQTTEIVFVGQSGLAPQAQRAVAAFPMVNLVLQRIFRDEFAGGRTLLMEQGFGPLSSPGNKRRVAILSAAEGSHVLAENNQYTVKALSGIPVITFK